MYPAVKSKYPLIYHEEIRYNPIYPTRTCTTCDNTVPLYRANTWYTNCTTGKINFRIKRRLRLTSGWGPMGKARKKRRGKTAAAISKATNPLHGNGDGPGQKSELLRIRLAQKQPGLSRGKRRRLAQRERRASKAELVKRAEQSSST